MTSNKLKQELMELGRQGCSGLCKDFHAWVLYRRKGNFSLEEVTDILNGMIASGEFKISQHNRKDYRLNEPIACAEREHFWISRNLDFAPLQMARSRLETFLRYHTVSEDDLIDISIATTEAIENAIKYSNKEEISISYQLKDNQFEISIINSVDDIVPERDIESGKYSSDSTLMRGMMVMMKLFDELDISISEERQEAVFYASKMIS